MISIRAGSVQLLSHTCHFSGDASLSDVSLLIRQVVNSEVSAALLHRTPSRRHPHTPHSPPVDHQHFADITAMLRTAAKALLESGSLTHAPLQPYCIAPVLQVRFVKREHCGQQHQSTVHSQQWPSSWLTSAHKQCPINCTNKIGLAFEAFT